MAGWRLEIWGAAGLLLVSVLIGIPVGTASLGGSDVIAGPEWLWWLCYGCFPALLALCFLGHLVPRLDARYLLIPLELTAAGVVLLAPRGGFLPILLVFVTALAAELASVRVVAPLLLGNGGVIAVAVGMAGAAPGEMVVLALIYLVLQACSVWMVWSNRREAEHRRRLAVAHTELRAATALLAESSRATERLRIARELHDLVGHQLTALVLELEIAAHRSAPPADAHVARARAVARDLLGDVRTAVGELRGTPQRLDRALREIVADLPHPRVHLEVADSVAPDEASAAALIRCAQEVVTNAIRHSEADNLWIRIGTDESGAITLSARDDGLGTPVLRLGNGLTGLRERIESLGGHVRFDTRSGFRVDAAVPAS
ncbi:sensor histidine kinase [Saccharopolyspora sp. CA-218241]|uniref:sensor histidine kinase n=1 Tax=Saccharopolyspora sp. CA-218241 TaxID=3240027 RepID=UPI003D9683AA